MAELGKVVKTIFLCQYLQSESLRREINEALNVVESWNNANSFIFFGKGKEIQTNRLEEQEIAVLSLHLLQSALVYVNTLMVQEVLSEPNWMEMMQSEDLRGLTPLFWSHVNPYGTFQLNLDERLPLLNIAVDFRESETKSHQRFRARLPLVAASLGLPPDRASLSFPHKQRSPSIK